MEAGRRIKGAPSPPRGPGAGVARALRAIDYRGWVVAETFAGRVPEIAAATAIWRDDIVPDAWAYARDSVAFMRRLLG